MELLGYVAQMEAILGFFGDRCTVYAKCTIGLEIFLGHPTVVLVDVSQVEARFGQFGDSVNLDTRYVYGLRRACNRI
jgi:hypothetical protein